VLTLTIAQASGLMSITCWVHGLPGAMSAWMFGVNV